MPDERTGDDSGGVFSGYGIGSAVLGVVAVVAVALAVLIWTGHRSDVDERRHQTRVLQAAAEWTGVLINMNKDTVEASMRKLHEGTVGELNTDFEAAVQPYRRLVQTLQSRTTGQVDSVAIESLHRVLPNPDGTPAPTRERQPELMEVAARTDTVLVVATSVSENPGSDQPQTVRWTLRLDVSEVDGRLLISRLDPIR